jgi:hypothetical protein
MIFFVSLQAEMRKIAILTVSFMAMLIVSCGQKKKDAAYYEHMVDSIRKAEQVKELRRQAGISDVDPLEDFFLKLSLRSLPVQSEGRKWEKLGEFTKVPRTLNEHFGYLSAAELQVMSLPRAGRYQVVMLLEMQDSITPALYLYTLDHEHRNIDQLCIYEERAEDRATDFGRTMMDYYITSDWEITLMKYYLSNEATSPQLEETRRYVINKEGRFEEVIIEL